MSEYEMPPRVAENDAIDVNDFVYAATGVCVRRLTMPDGEHWFPAVDVCAELGHTNARKAIIDHVHAGGTATLETVTSRYGLGIPAGREWRRDLNMVNMQGLIRLVNACSKPEAEPFKIWVAEVVVAIQREGSYSLSRTEVTPAEDNTATGYIVPAPLMDTLARIEERNIRLDEQFTNEHKQRMMIEEQMLELQRQAVDIQRQSLAVQHVTTRVQQEASLALKDAARSLKEVSMAQMASVELRRELAGTMERLSDSVQQSAAVPARPTIPRRPNLASPMDVVDAMRWHEFEEYVARLCRRDGCTDVVVSGRRGDLGADVTGRTTDGRRFVVQCKHYAPHRTVPNSDMQKFVGTAALEHRADVAVFVATCAFTAASIELAERRGITVVSRAAFEAWNAGSRLEVL